MKILKKLLLLVVSLSFLEGAEINRRLLAVYDKAGGDTEMHNSIHQHFEAVLNYYGYYCDYYEMQKLPQKTDEYAGVVVWLGGDMIDDPVGFATWLANEKKAGKKIVWIGNIPVRNKTTNYSKAVNEIVKKEFGFWGGDEYSNNPLALKITEKSDIFDFERKLNSFTLDGYIQIEIGKDKKPLLKLEIKGVDNSLSAPVFTAPWGFYADEGKVFFSDGSEKNRRWIANPYEIVKRVFDVSYPIPDVTTVDAKRAIFIHVDGDGILSNSEVKQNASTGEVGFERVFSKYPFKSGVSFIAGELDKKLFGSDKALFWAKKILSLPHIEAATHTYTHPFEWSSGKVAYSVDKNAIKVKHGTVDVWQSPDKKVNNDFEIARSAKFINAILPKNKKVEALYWTGDCLPTASDIEYADKLSLAAINGGDTRVDAEYASLAFVRPIGRYTGGKRQIYTAMSNENMYTELWTDKFWAHKGVVDTFENTEKPKRIKPINLYYHHYSFEKKASLESLIYIYEYINRQKESLSFIYPSEYVRKARNFYTVKILKLSENGYKIEGATHLKEFRLNGLFNIKNTQNVKSAKQDLRQNVTYITLGDGESGYFEAERP